MTGFVVYLNAFARSERAMPCAPAEAQIIDLSAARLSVRHIETHDVPVFHLDDDTLIQFPH